MKRYWERKPILLAVCLLGAGLITGVQLVLQTTAQDRVLRSTSQAFALQTAAQLEAFIEHAKDKPSFKGTAQEPLAAAIDVFNRAAEPRMVKVHRVELHPLQETPAERFSSEIVAKEEWTTYFKVLSLSEKTAVQISVRNASLSAFGQGNAFLGELFVLQNLLLWSAAFFLGVTWKRLRENSKQLSLDLQQARLRIASLEVKSGDPVRESAITLLNQQWERFKELVRSQGGYLRDLLHEIRSLRDRMIAYVQETRGLRRETHEQLTSVHSLTRELKLSKSLWRELDALFYNYALEWERNGGDPIRTDEFIAKMLALRNQTELVFDKMRAIESVIESRAMNLDEVDQKSADVQTGFQSLGEPIERFSSHYVNQVRVLDEMREEFTLWREQVKGQTSGESTGALPPTIGKQPWPQDVLSDHPSRRWG